MHLQKISTHVSSRKQTLAEAFLPIGDFCGICRRQCHYELKGFFFFLKIMYRTLCKTEGSKLGFYMTNKYFHRNLEYAINNVVLE